MLSHLRLFQHVFVLENLCFDGTTINVLLYLHTSCLQQAHPYFINPTNFGMDVFTNFCGCIKQRVTKKKGDAKFFRIW